MREIQEGVFEHEKRLYTLNLVKGATVYQEPLIQENGKEYREWNPFRSKLGAAIVKGVKGIDIKKSSIVLYLGAASGTTVSHVSDICGTVFAVEFSPEVFAELYLLAGKRKNLIPMLCDANQPEGYYHRLTAVDVLYQDIAQRNQVEIFKRNCQLFLKKGGIGVLCVKSRSIDVAQSPQKVFAEVKEALSEEFKILDHRILAPFQKDHAVFLNRKL